jgi:AraC family transcriptional activator of tynA and feaB
MRHNPPAPAAPHTPLRHFSTGAVASEDDADLFQSEMHRLFSISLSVRTSSPRPLSARMSAYCGKNLRFATLRFSPHSTVWAPGSTSADARLLVSVHKEGVAMVSQGGDAHRVDAGDIFVIDPARPFHIETGSISSHSLYLSASAVRALVPDIDHLTALPIRGDHPAAAIFRSAADELVARAATLEESVADGLSEALPYLLAPALACLGPANGQAMSGRLRQLHRRRITQFVRDHLADPKLDVHTIAQGVDLSPRHLYELFSDEALPLMKWVWSERLDHCRRDLLQPKLKRRTVGEIAYSWGFSDVSHFSRAFKQRFGLTPRDCRLGRGSEPLAPQAEAP